MAANEKAKYKDLLQTLDEDITNKVINHGYITSIELSRHPKYTDSVIFRYFRKKKAHIVSKCFKKVKSLDKYSSIRDKVYFTNYMFYMEDGIHFNYEKDLPKNTEINSEEYENARALFWDFVREVTSEIVILSTERK